ncbi:hypothetical protein [Cellulomonas shaoxiangyii]|uniref:Uncharacterized protein n=1 Tax=Cellulomonas shaoxiangyii TaxID=2566013 RepID=A0A4P7SGP2_9CELL|nr:hypothetical protein [Cellulomonas shaoxiangyii]QCB93329.1 hypothetical protein E5225_06955 [Cellulomonas shaoxiangyii]TGY79434.1 hypothetical protein E5226_15485 [Cellulomonas shaoxiangyii]
MSEDKYVRVIRDEYGYGWRISDELGTHKVVPADALVIERGELHEVDPNVTGTGCIVGGEFYEFGTIERHEREARDHLAIAEYLRAHPPVDEAQVEAVTKALYEATTDPHEIDVPDVARRLVARGVRVEVTP